MERTCSGCGRRLALDEFSPGQGRCKVCRRDLMREHRQAARAEFEQAERVRFQEEHKLRVEAAHRAAEAGKRQQAKMLESLGFTRGPDGLYVPPKAREATNGAPTPKRRRSFPQVNGSTTARGYGSRHQAERKRWQPLVQAGLVACVRCGLTIEPGSRWHLDHDDDKLGWLGPSHAACNLSAGGQLGNQRMRERNAPEDPARAVRRTSREW